MAEIVAAVVAANHRGEQVVVGYVHKMAHSKDRPFMGTSTRTERSEYGVLLIGCLRTAEDAADAVLDEYAKYGLDRGLSSGIQAAVAGGVPG